MSMNIFERALRKKLRFETQRGMLSVEDIWDLPLLGGALCLDELAKELHRAVRDSCEESFVVREVETEADKDLNLRFELVKYVIKARLREKETAEKIAETKLKKQKLVAILAEKEDEDLKGMSSEEIRAMIDEM